jgi:hypothetical protein
MRVLKHSTMSCQTASPQPSPHAKSDPELSQLRGVSPSFCRHLWTALTSSSRDRAYAEVPPSRADEIATG